MKVRSEHNFQAMAKHVGLKWGLSAKTKIRLYFQVFLAKKLYAAPVWARKNLCILHTSNGKNVKQALSAPISSSNCVAEILAWTTPLDLHCDTLTATFLKKVMLSNEKLCSGVSRQECETRHRDFEGLRENRKLWRTKLQPYRNNINC